MKRWRARLVSVLLILASGCGGNITPTPIPVATLLPAPTPTVITTPAAPLPTASLDSIHPAKIETPLPPTPALTLPPTATPAARIRPSYQLAAEVDARAHTVMVTATVSLAPPDAQELVFNVGALQVPETFQLLDLRVNAASVAWHSEGVWLHVALPAGFDRNSRLTVLFAYRLTLHPIQNSALGWRGTLGWTSRQINLGDWYPVLAVLDPQRGWITHAPAVIGEYQTAEVANFEVTLSATGFAAKPLILGSGQPTACAAQCFALAGGRFVAYTLSDQMQSQSVTTTNGVTVTSAYFPGHVVAGRAALEVAAAALDRFSQLYGAYPYSTFALVEGDFFDGMEYSGLSFVGQVYYSAYDQSANNWLTAITAHETAHQWWYSLVGNDQAQEPWLDEALCTYSELVYLEAAHPKVVPHWWSWRVNIHHPAGSVSSPIYAFSSFQPYVNAIYLRGALMLQAMRQAVGDEHFFAFVHRYAQDNAGQVATAADFWRAYESLGGDATAIKSLFFDEQ